VTNTMLKVELHSEQESTRVAFGICSPPTSQKIAADSVIVMHTKAIVFAVEIMIASSKVYFLFEGFDRRSDNAALLMQLVPLLCRCFESLVPNG